MLAEDHPDYWAEYYELGWREELKLFDSVLDPKETNALRAINYYNRIVSGYERIVYESSGGAVLDNQTAEKTGTGLDLFVLRKREDKPKPPPELALPTGKAPVINSIMQGRGFQLPQYIDLDEQVERFLLDYIILHPEIEAVVDLGSGTGQRLIKFFYMGCPSHVRLYSAEQSESARALNQRLVDLDAGLDISIHAFNFRRPDFSFVREKKHVLFFTALSIMFIHEVGRTPFEAMVRAADAATGIHFEPVGFQISTPTYEYSKLQAQEANSRNWNIDLGSVLQDLHNLGVIEVKYSGKDILPAKDPGHALSVTLWHKTAKAASSD